MNAELQRLIDESQIRDVAHRYARALDRLDFELLRTCYHTDGYEDHGPSYRGGVDGFIAWLQTALAPFERTMHFITNQRVELDGSTAWAESYGHAVHRWQVSPERPAPTETTTLVRYVDRLERRAGEWRSCHRVTVYELGRTDVLAEAQDLSGRTQGVRGPDDVSYTRTPKK